MGVCHSYMKNQCSAQNESEKLTHMLTNTFDKERKENQQKQENYQEEFSGTENKSKSTQEENNQIIQLKPILKEQKISLNKQEENKQNEQEEQINQKEQECSQTPTFFGRSDKLTNKSNQPQIQKLLEGLKAGGIISNQPLQALIELKLKSSQDPENSNYSFKNSINNNNSDSNQPQSLKRSTTLKFSNTENTNNNNLQQQEDPNLFQLQENDYQENNENKQKQKAKHMRTRKRFQTKQFDANNNEAEDFFEGKTQKYILKNRNSQSASKLKKKTVIINEEDNQLHHILKVQNSRSYY